MGTRHPRSARGSIALVIAIACSWLVAVPVLGQDASGPPGTPAPSVSLDPSQVRFRITYVWENPDIFENGDLSKHGTATMDGQVSVSLFQEAQPSEDTADSDTWRVIADQAVDYYDASTCPGDDLTQCGVCTATYHGEVPVEVDLRVDERTETQVVIRIWPFMDVDPASPEFLAPGCIGVPTGHGPSSGFSPMHLTAALDATGVGALDIGPAPDSMSGEIYEDPFGTLSIERLP